MLWFSKSLEEPRATLEPIFSHAQLPVEGQPELARAALSKAEEAGSEKTPPLYFTTYANFNFSHAPSCEHAARGRCLSTAVRR